MQQLLSMVLSFVALACHSATTRPGSRAEPGSVETSAAPAPCAEPPGVARLTSYSEAAVTGRYWVDLRFVDGAWLPAEPVAMPHHHASRLELTNAADFAQLVAARDRLVRCTFDVVSREVHQVPGRPEWRATYFAKIVALEPCGGAIIVTNSH